MKLLPALSIKQAGAESFLPLNAVLQVSATVVEGGRPAIPSPEAVPGGASSPKGLPTFLQLIERCWAQNPQDRPSFVDIVGELMWVNRRAQLPAGTASVLSLGSQACKLAASHFGGTAHACLASSP